MIGNGQNYITLFLMITPDIPAQTAEDYEVIFLHVHRVAVIYFYGDHISASSLA